MFKKLFFCQILVILCLLGIVFPVLAGDVLATRVKDIARLEGVRANQLTGMGLVVGLGGTGDSSKADAQIVVRTLTKWGININVGDMKVRNIAAVMITANLEPFLHPGEAFDVQVASFSDAKSLQGGILLQSPLTGADGKVYAVAQGPVYLGGYAASSGRGGGASQQKSVTTVGIVSGGAIVEHEVPMQFNANGKLVWVLNHPDFTTANRLAKTIHDNINSGAKALDMGRIEVQIPEDRKDNPIAVIADIETLPVTPDGVAKVVVNERTGTVVIGDNVRIAPVAVSHGNITVKINNDQANNQGKGTSSDNPSTGQPSVEVAEDKGNLVMLPAGTSIGTIVRALNAVGSTPQDIIALLVAIKDSGALYGVLEFQ